MKNDETTVGILSDLIDEYEKIASKYKGTMHSDDDVDLELFRLRTASWDASSKCASQFALIYGWEQRHSETRRRQIYNKRFPHMPSVNDDFRRIDFFRDGKLIAELIYTPVVNKGGYFEKRIKAAKKQGWNVRPLLRSWLYSLEDGAMGKAVLLTRKF